ncbi:MAG: acyltransferase [Ferruginibacter sp.]
MSTTKAARLNWIDYARGIAIILVAYRHVFEGAKLGGVNVDKYPWLEYANIFFYSFRMPLFFIVSGVFISWSVQKWGIKKYVEGRLRTILYPYFVWGALQLTLQMVFADYSNGKPDPSAYLHLFYLPREIAQFWYLFALFNVSMLYLLTRFVLKVPPLLNLLLGILMFYASAIIYQKNIPTAFAFDILHYYLFFVIGDMARSVLVSDSFRQTASKGQYLLVSLLLFIVCQSYFLWQNLRHSTAKFMYVEFYQPFIFIVIAMVGCIFIMFLTNWLDRQKIMRWLPRLGKYSLYIYVAHVIVFAALRMVMTKLFHINDALIIIGSGMIAGITVPVILYRLADRFNMRWIFTLEKKKTKPDIANQSKTAPAAG